MSSVGTVRRCGPSSRSRPGTIPSRKSSLDRHRATARSSARRSATTSICATSKAARRCCSARPRTTTPSASLGPFIRLFDASLLARRRAQDAMSPASVDGEDGFVLDGDRSMIAEISRGRRTICGRRRSARTTQYPDGVVLYLGTMFAPVKDRGGAGQGLHPQARRHRHHLRAAARRAASTACRLAPINAPPWTYRREPSHARPRARGLLN